MSTKEQKRVLKNPAVETVYITDEDNQPLGIEHSFLNQDDKERLERFLKGASDVVSVVVDAPDGSSVEVIQD
ncbi:TPA: hypothetical protein EYO12_04365 [Candidatus Saccharibacteria bacterium]|nr:hypothetical protein [Candidatus Saccharibacteria bacterium]HIO87731.1 hypothetical protein [Candidatus Saccharibacteria bacterium]